MLSKYRGVVNKYRILIPLLISNYLRGKGSRPSKKFIILTRSRTGSTMLINLLRKIPNSYVQSEMLRRKFMLPFWKKIPDLIFGNHSKHYDLAGFKCFYYHPIDDWDDNGFIYKYIFSHPDIKVIHWQREDLFAVLISRSIATKTKRWAKTKKDSNIEDFFINEHQFIYDLEKTLSQIKVVRKLFSNYSNYFELTYEDVVKRNRLNELFEFLQVDGRNIRYNSDSRQKSENKYKSIVNIENLRVIYNRRISEINK